MNWKISDFLPNSVHKNFTVRVLNMFSWESNILKKNVFKAIIAGYLGSIHEALKGERETTVSQNNSALAKANIDKTQFLSVSLSNYKSKIIVIVVFFSSQVINHRVLK